MKERTLTLALGTNLGNREDNLKQALSLLEGCFGPAVESSTVLETEAIGFEGPAFLNMLVRYRCSRRPLTVLRLCKEMERSMGRTDEPRYAEDGTRIYENRIIDIDILTYGELEVSTQDLVIPHPALYSRPFIGELLLTLRPL